eukprot:4412676-Heterocapsa_arctica.AAC.1
MGTKHWQLGHHSFMVKTGPDHNMTCIKATPKGGMVKRKVRSDEQHMSDGKGSQKGLTEGGSQYDPSDHRATPRGNPQPQGSQGR